MGIPWIEGCRLSVGTRLDLGKPCAFDEIGAQGKVGIVEWEVWACWLVGHRSHFGDPNSSWRANPERHSATGEGY